MHWTAVTPVSHFAKCWTSQVLPLHAVVIGAGTEVVRAYRASTHHRSEYRHTRDMGRVHLVGPSAQARRATKTVCELAYRHVCMHIDNCVQICVGMCV